jgi:putative intracellular protease/amidase
MSTGDHLQIAIPLFDRFTALDGVGPYEVLQRIPFFDVTFVGHATGRSAVRTGCSASWSTPCSRTCPSPT